MAAKWLSFNESVSPGKFPNLPEEETEEAQAALREPMPLRRAWVLWEQVASGSYATKKIVQFSTAQEFWSIWNGVPQPSELLEGKRFMKEQSNGPAIAIDALMIFAEGISPEWEDGANAQGGHFQIQLKPPSGGGQIDEYWNNLVLAMVGETMESSHIITGLRLVDKLSGGNRKVTDVIRLELWYHSKASAPEINALRKAMERTLMTRIDGSQGATFKGDAIQDKKHSQMSK
eukprot:CAMPEP_0204526062 /NCGR_PEP_ID=MMETSP0661-20131031/8234_1 /ASSEMBLY_ACC=CAM_ASM_000606 /TAXON_ID=109239 /ORGANISM="Alexandrium margalefi, Strain AMGDE01CS-322" /LENGTH=231 /DNA_ID=CAMNT_0051531889 /DNA_START=73 /DNA_END=771 /DNA_ORIENTATION=+